MADYRRLKVLEAIAGRRPPVPYAEIQAAELRLSGGVPVREQLMTGGVQRPDYPDRELDERLVRDFYAQYRTMRSARERITEKINRIAGRVS